MVIVELLGLALFCTIVVWPLLTYLGDFARYLKKKGER